ncbi:MAG: hypothetical protein KJ061_06620 [Vicinamibacteraceae bacterium]|nr:hypothetical protein [Vicinamibacteraceae bacterium]
MTRATILSRGLSVLACCLAFGAPATAQPASGASKPAPSTSTTGATPPAQGYSYNPDGRRDPFVSLVNRGSDTSSASSRPSGLAGLMMHEIAVKGIVRSRGALVAMIEAPDAKTYLIRRGDRLFDASVKAVTADAVVFVQQVNDPLSLVKQREIRKPLRVAEEGK